MESAIKELRSFFIDKKHIDVVANSTEVVENSQITFEYGVAE
jgi:hypothetical protein